MPPPPGEPTSYQGKRQGLRSSWLLALTGMLTAVPAHGEQFLALAGITGGNTPPNSSYGWELAFQKPLSPRFSASLAWINEGHFAQHSRDGAAGQLWLTGAKWWQGRVALELGIGPYIYFDTQPTYAVGNYSDIHGAGGILSASLAIALTKALSIDLRANEIITSGNFNSQGLLLGVAYSLGHSPTREAQGDASGHPSRADSGSVLQAFGGKLISNALPGRETRALGVDYRIAVVRWAAWSATWFDDLEGGHDLHQRLATQILVARRSRRSRLDI